MSQVNLLPPELREKQVTRRVTTLVAALGAAVLALIVVFYFFQGMRLSDANDELARQEQANGQLQTQIAELQPYADLQAELATKQKLVDTLYLNEVSWAGVLLDVSRVIPDESYLTALNGQITAPTGTQAAGVPTTGAVSNLIGSVTFSGVARETFQREQMLSRAAVFVFKLDADDRSVEQLPQPHHWASGCSPFHTYRLARPAAEPAPEQTQTSNPSR